MCLLCVAVSNLHRPWASCMSTGGHSPSLTAIFTHTLFIYTELGIALWDCSVCRFVSMLLCNAVLIAYSLRQLVRRSSTFYYKISFFLRRATADANNLIVLFLVTQNFCDSTKSLITTLVTYFKKNRIQFLSCMHH